MTHDERDGAIVRAIVGLARDLGLRTVAEGVEAPEDVRALRRIGCDAIQDWLLQRPLPADELEAWFDAEAAPPLAAPHESFEPGRAARGSVPRGGTVPRDAAATPAIAVLAAATRRRLWCHGGMPRSALTTAAALLLTAAPAAAAPQLVIRGGGFGHGVGMSQWGAQGQALQGRGYRAILGSSYFPGTKVATPARIERTLRVRLTAAPNASFSGASKAGTSTLNPRTTYRARLLARVSNKAAAAACSTIPTRATISGRGPLTVSGLGRYRGALELSAAADANDVSGNLQVVNRVSVEDYLRGVVTQEERTARGSRRRWRRRRSSSRTYAVAVVKAGTVGTTTTPTRARRSTAASPPRRRPSTAPCARPAARSSRTAAERCRSTSTPAPAVAPRSPRGLGATPQPWLMSVADPATDAQPTDRTAGPGGSPRDRRAAARRHGRLRGIVARDRAAPPQGLGRDRERRESPAAAAGRRHRKRPRLSCSSSDPGLATHGRTDQSAFSYSTIEVR